jgi:hypothetical protein
MDIIGQMIALMLADPVLCAGQTVNSVLVPGLLPNGPYMGKEQPDEIPAPPAVLLSEDVQKPAEWLLYTSRLEPHVVKAVCYAEQSATAGQDNPAKTLADNVERLANFFDVGTASTTVMSAVRTTRSLSESPHRSRRDLPVYVARIEWAVLVWVHT